MVLAVMLVFIAITTSLPRLSTFQIFLLLFASFGPKAVMQLNYENMDMSSSKRGNDVDLWVKKKGSVLECTSLVFNKRFHSTQTIYFYFCE